MDLHHPWKLQVDMWLLASKNFALQWWKLSKILKSSLRGVPIIIIKKKKRKKKNLGTGKIRRYHVKVHVEDIQNPEKLSITPNGSGAGGVFVSGSKYPFFGLETLPVCSCAPKICQKIVLMDLHHPWKLQVDMWSKKKVISFQRFCLHSGGKNRRIKSIILGIFFWKFYQ